MPKVIVCSAHFPCALTTRRGSTPPVACHLLESLSAWKRTQSSICILCVLRRRHGGPAAPTVLPGAKVCQGRQGGRWARAPALFNCQPGFATHSVGRGLPCAPCVRAHHSVPTVARASGTRCSQPPAASMPSMSACRPCKTNKPTNQQASVLYILDLCTTRFQPGRGPRGTGQGRA